MTDEVPGIRVEREVTIHARPATVFRFFTDPGRRAAWLGSGEILEVEPDSRIVLTRGHPVPSRVEVTLTAVPEGTHVALTHHVPSDEMHAEHVVRWRYDLAVLAAVAERAEHAGGSAPRADREALPDLEPHWWVGDLPRATALFTGPLGFRTIATFPDGGEPTWVSLRRGNAVVMMAARPDPARATGSQAYVAEVADRIGTGGPISIYVRVEDVDAVHEKVAAWPDATIIEPIWNPFWGGRQFTLADPDGNWVTIFGERA